jgi:hypothetical protein
MNEPRLKPETYAVLSRIPNEWSHLQTTKELISLALDVPIGTVTRRMSVLGRLHLIERRERLDGPEIRRSAMVKSTRPPQIRLLFDQPFERELVIDGFAGGGGASTGIEMALGRSPDVAINHDREALAMHRVNHPKTRHLRSNIRKVRYRVVCRGKTVAFGWFSPDCTFHSKARGGKPFRDRNRARRIRGLAWEVVRCAIEVRPRVLFMENVEELKDWCPLDAHGRPEWTKRGKSFLRWVARLRNLGYVVDWRVLRASDFGAPTSRKRLFVIARCDGQAIVWPEPTHGPSRTGLGS